MALENQIRSTNQFTRALGRSYSLEAAIPSVIHRGYYQIQRYTQAGMGDQSLTSFEFKWDDRAVQKEQRAVADQATTLVSLLWSALSWKLRQIVWNKN